MRAGYWAVALIIGLSSLARAADEPKPEEWKKLYQDSAAQLRAAQDRKAELSGENAKLTARVAELEKQLQAADTQVQTLRRQTDGFAQRTFFLNTFCTAWESFVRYNPQLLTEWKVYWGQNFPAFPNAGTCFRDPFWPLSAKG